MICPRCCLYFVPILTLATVSSYSTYLVYENYYCFAVLSIYCSILCTVLCYMYRHRTPPLAVYAGVYVRMYVACVFFFVILLCGKPGDHGDEPGGHAWPCSAATGSAGPQDRVPRAGPTAKANGLHRLHGKNEPQRGASIVQDMY